VVKGLKENAAYVLFLGCSNLGDILVTYFCRRTLLLRPGVGRVMDGAAKAARADLGK
jgi:hypothetical protein